MSVAKLVTVSIRLWLSLLLATVTCSVAKTLTDGKLFLIGGATQDSSSNIYDALRESAGKPNPNIAVVISAAGSLAIGLEAYYIPEEGSNSYEQLFIGYGFQPSVVVLAIDNYEEGSTSLTQLGRDNIQKIRNADIVFFNGGDQSRHSRSWLHDDGTDTDIMEVLREQYENNGTVIAGTSAGTAVQCDPLFGGGTSFGYYYYNTDMKECQIGEELADDRDGDNSFRYDENGAFMKGFGFLRDSLLDTHFDARGRFGRLIVAMQQLGKPFGFGIDEDTGLYVYNGFATVFGNSGVWVLDISSASFIDEYYFRIEGVRAHYLTHGDSVNLDTLQIQTTKPVISPTTEDLYESEDIFGPNQGLASILSLVRAEGVTESEGHSYDIEPTAKVLFTKTNYTKAYFLNEKYAIENLLIDISTYKNKKY